MSERIDNPSYFADEALPSAPVIIKCIGVGGGGNNAVDHMYRSGVENVSFVNINTDKQALDHCAVPHRLVIGPGLGAGNDPEKGRLYAEESADSIAELFNDDTKMVFITAGMGGGTGTGAAPVVARIAREHDMLTIGIVTIPFIFEGRRKIAKALDGADEIAKHCDAVMIINNERLVDIYPDLDMINGFAKADDTLTIAARSISELISQSGHINLDFNDVDTTLRDGGAAIISTGYGEGENRIHKAIQDALHSPLLKNRDIMTSKKILFNLYFSQDEGDRIRLNEIDELTEFINDIDPAVDVIWGMTFDNTLGNTVKVTLLASGFEVSLHDEQRDFQNRRKRPVTGGMTRIEREYGDSFQSGNERAKYVILTDEQLDNDAVIELLETHPTYAREKSIVEQIRKMNVATGGDTTGKSSGNVISF